MKKTKTTSLCSSSYRFPHNAERDIANEIQDTQLAAILMRDVIENGILLDSRDQVSLNAYLQTDFGMDNYSLSTDSVDLLDYWSLDVGAWEFPRALPSDAMFISKNLGSLDGMIAGVLALTAATQEELADQDGDYTISIAPFVDVLRGALDGLIEKHGRTYEEIINGTPAYSEDSYVQDRKISYHQTRQHRFKSFIFTTQETRLQEFRHSSIRK